MADEEDRLRAVKARFALILEVVSECESRRCAPDEPLTLIGRKGLDPVMVA